MSIVPASATTPGVSVIVPVYNPAAYLSATIASLLAQSLPADQLELIFVDDGSTDGSAQLLDELAAAHPAQVTVRHIPNSGWPGRPRNIGVGLARHDYVFFCDADDWMPPYTLELLKGRGDTDGSDIVIGRIVANKRPINIAMFEAGDRVTTWRDTPGVFYNLTSQKLFRTSFLREIGLQFPEGRVRMEDFQYMTEAYLRSQRISIVGSRPCYFLEWRDDQGNLTASRATDDERLAGIERTMKIIIAHTEPGPDRDRVFERVVKTELVGHATHPTFLDAPAEQQQAYVARARQLFDTYVPAGVRDILDTRSQLRLDALLAGDLKVIADMRDWSKGVKGRLASTTATWADGRLRCTADVGFVRDDEPVTVDRQGDRLFSPPGRGPVLDVTGGVKHMSAWVSLRSRDNFEQWRVRADLRLHPDATTGDTTALRWIATFDLDPRTLASGQALRTGVWDLDLRLSGCALDNTMRLTVPATGTPAPAVLGDVIAIPYPTKFGNLSLDVGQASRSLARELQQRGVRRTSRRGRVELSVSLVAVDAQPPQAHLVSARTRRVSPVPASIASTASDTAVITLATPARTSERDVARLRWGSPGSGPMVVVGPPAPAAGKKAAAALAAAEQAAAERAAAERAAAERAAAERAAAERAAAAKPAADPARTTSLSSDVDIVTRGDATVSTRRLTGAAWLVTAADDGPDGVRVFAPGDRGWLVERCDAAPQAEPRLEVQITQLLGRRHVAWLLEEYEVDVVLDVGANEGQYATSLRRDGYRGHIVSFEPVPQYADRLRTLSADDDKWSVHEVALGEQDGTLPLNVQSVFSSLLSSSEFGRTRFSTLAEGTGGEQVEVPIRRLDAIWDDLLAPALADASRAPRVFLKLDTQGFDLKAFAGVGDRLDDVVAMQSEVALLPIYEHMPRMAQSLATYEAAGFEISGLYPVTRQPDGRVIEYDCTLVRADRRPARDDGAD